MLAEEFDRALERLVRASRDKSRTDLGSLHDAVSTICEYATEAGLLGVALEKILGLLCHTRILDQYNQSRLIEALFPRETVSDDALYMVVACLGSQTSKPSATTQQSLLRWLVLIHRLLANPATLHRLYSTLFGLLDVSYLHADLLHLLALQTRPKHVTLYRIDLLKRWENTSSGNAGFTKMMQAYERCVPGTFTIPDSDLPLSYPSLDLQWTNKLSLIHAADDHLQSPDIVYGLANPNLANELGKMHITCESKMAVLRNVESPMDLARALESAMPSQIAFHNLENSLIHSCITLRPGDDLGIDRLNECLNPVLDRQKQLLDEGNDLDKSLLEILLNLTRHLKHLPDSISNFLAEVLPIWRPAVDFESERYVVELLTYLPISTWNGLYDTYFEPMEVALLEDTTSKVQSLASLLSYYTGLISTWKMSMTTIEDRKPTKEECEVISSLVSYTSILALTLLSISRDDDLAIATSVILDHYESQLPLFQHSLGLHLPPPDPILIYTMIFTSPSIAIISRISGLLAEYKYAFEHIPTAPIPMPPQVNGHSTANKSTRPSNDIHSLNAELIDACNLLLRSRAFNTTDTHALGCMLAPSLIQALSLYTTSLSPHLELTNLFSLSYHTSITALSNTAFREIEATHPGDEIRHAGPVTQRSLAILARHGGVKLSWREYRVHVLRWLESVGVTGISDLGRATMRGLMGADGRQASKEDEASKP